MHTKLTPEIFWSLGVRRESGCLEWSRHKDKNGYGKLKYEGDYWLSHRLAWSLKNGPIPEGICVCHHCDNPSCMETDHLFLGTHSDNMHDMKQKGRRKGINAGDKNGRARLSKETARMIRAQYAAGGITQVELSKLYDVTQGAISYLVTGRSWKDS